MEVSDIEVRPRKINQYMRSRTKAWREYSKKPRIYVSPEGETVLEHLFDRHNRPTKEFRAAALSACEKIGLIDVKLRWSQYAGCTCPCSPGFVIEEHVGTPSKDLYKFDVFVEVK